MDTHNWNIEKNLQLQEERSISSEEEAELLRSVEAGEWRPVPEMQRELQRHREIAQATFKKDQRINIRLSSRDLTELKERASLEGIPYQTLITSILHKYVNGRLKNPSYA